MSSQTIPVQVIIPSVMRKSSLATSVDVVSLIMQFQLVEFNTIISISLVLQRDSWHSKCCSCNAWFINTPCLRSP